MMKYLKCLVHLMTTEIDREAMVEVNENTWMTWPAAVTDSFWTTRRYE